MLTSIAKYGIIAQICNFSPKSYTYIQMSNKSQFEKLYFDIADEVYRYAYFKLGNQTEAEDVTSETFLRMITKDDLVTIENPKAWAIGVARNIVYEMYRERKLENGIQNAEDSEIPDPELEPDAQALTEEMYVLIKEKINELDEATREVIILKTWEELKFSEIAALQNEKESTVKLRYYRGLEKLRLLIEEEDRRASLATAKVVTLPILLAGFARLGTEPAYAISSQFTTTLHGLLQTQHVATAGANLNVNSQIMESNIPSSDDTISRGMSLQQQVAAINWAQILGVVIVGVVVIVATLIGASAYLNSTANSNTSAAAINRGVDSLVTTSNMASTASSSAADCNLIYTNAKYPRFQLTYDSCKATLEETTSAPKSELFNAVDTDLVLTLNNRSKLTLRLQVEGSWDGGRDCKSGLHKMVTSKLGRAIINNPNSRVYDYTDLDVRGSADYAALMQAAPDFAAGNFDYCYYSDISVGLTESVYLNPGPAGTPGPMPAVVFAKLEVANGLNLTDPGEDADLADMIVGSIRMR